MLRLTSWLRIVQHNHRLIIGDPFPPVVDQINVVDASVE